MTEPVTAREESRLPALTGLRWYAALLVFLLHVSIAAPDWVAAGLFGWGGSGVSFFFILSGFVLAWGHRPGAPRTFWWRRFARVWPAHFVTFLVSLPLLHVLGKQFDVGSAVLNVLLLQAWAPSQPVAFGYNAVSWSLACEAFFYACFPFLYVALVRLSERARWMAAAAGLAAAGLVTVALLALFRGEDLGYWSYYMPLVRLPEFVLGIVLALAIRGGWRSPVSPWAAAGVVAVAAVFTETVVPGGVLKTYPMVLPFALLIAAVASAPQGSQLRLLSGRVGVYLGEVSFAFYLVHLMVVTVLARVDSLHRSPWLLLVVSLAVSLVAAAALHHGVEKPARALLLNRGARVASTA